MDDEEIVADIAQQMLQYLGFETKVVKTGEEAIEDYREASEAGDPYALVIMDLNIPNGMGGGEAIKHILAINRQAKVIASSGYANDGIIRNYQSYGFVGSIGKPFDIDGLKEVIHSIVH